MKHLSKFAINYFFKSLLAPRFIVCGIFLLLFGCYSQDQQETSFNDVKAEKCYQEATTARPNHFPTQVETEIRYNRCKRN